MTYPNPHKRIILPLSLSLYSHRHLLPFSFGCRLSLLHLPLPLFPSLFVAAINISISPAAALVTIASLADQCRFVSPAAAFVPFSSLIIVWML